MAISPTGVWSAEEAQHHQHSDNLAQFLIGYLDKSKPVYDFGAGLGFYVNELNKAGLNALAIDGNRDANLLTDKFKQFDLSMPVTVDVRGSVICLEVMEHLEYKYHETLTQTIVNACDKYLILSCAEIGQAGLGHVGCRDINEVIADIENRGFKLQKDLTNKVRATIEEKTSWFQKTLLIFERI